jgi:RNA polymerase sigma-70 factor (ECF subfamily)
MPAAPVAEPLRSSKRAERPRSPPPDRATGVNSELAAGLVRLVPEVRAHAMRLAGDATVANDIAQDAIERALRFADRYDRGTNLRAWLLRITFNVFVTDWRRRRRERRALLHLASDPCAWTLPMSFGSPDAGDGALLASTRAKLDGLPEPFRAVVVLVDLEQRSYEETAAVLGVPVGTVMSRLHRARKRLAAEMSNERDAA